MPKIRRHRCARKKLHAPLTLQKNMHPSTHAQTSGRLFAPEVRCCPLPPGMPPEFSCDLLMLLWLVTVQPKSQHLGGAESIAGGFCWPSSLCPCSLCRIASGGDDILQVRALDPDSEQRLPTAPLGASMVALMRGCNGVTESTCPVLECRVRTGRGRGGGAEGGASRLAPRSSPAP